jgi:hypothetical protein
VLALGMILDKRIEWLTSVKDIFGRRIGLSVFVCFSANLCLVVELSCTQGRSMGSQSFVFENLFLSSPALWKRWKVAEKHIWA